ncbi:DUF5691 domain-containing protein [Planctomicrobium sp. SH668]|uniref:DUF5691 domain-containing protein n=1 Tax=Planctomicrobium sp. SH668 TaxID=3448126 RepID=UPI003F5BAEB1
MDPLVKTALLGTGQTPPPPLVDGDALDTLFVSKKIETSEREVLLRAGAKAIYQTAGRVLTDVPTQPPAPEDHGRVAPPELIPLLAPTLTTQSIGLLPEFLKIMVEEHFDFPTSLLPAAFAIQDSSRREKLKRVFRNRARWLAALNPEWTWVNENTGSDLDVSTFVEQIEEGSIQVRTRALAQLREVDPSLGRETLAKIIGTEKGDQKCKLLDQLRIGLSLEDETFLESLRSDRSRKVKEICVELLQLIPDSALSQRMRDRIRSSLVLEKDSRGKTLIRFDLPSELPADWVKDGIAATSQAGSGHQAYRIQQLLAALPLTILVEQLQMEPRPIIQAIDPEDEDSIRVGLIQSLIRHLPTTPEMHQWIQPLWEWSLKSASGLRPSQGVEADLFAAFVEAVPPVELDQALLWTLKRAADFPFLSFASCAEKLPAPWSSELSAEYLKFTRRFFQSRADVTASQWCQTLLPAAIGLSPSCFASALEPWSVAPDRQGVWRNAQLETHLQRFGEVIRFRHQFRQIAVSPPQGNSGE